MRNTAWAYWKDGWLLVESPYICCYSWKFQECCTFILEVPASDSCNHWSQIVTSSHTLLVQVSPLPLCHSSGCCMQQNQSVQIAALPDFSLVVFGVIKAHCIYTLEWRMKYKDCACCVCVFMCVWCVCVYVCVCVCVGMHVSFLWVYGRLGQIKVQFSFAFCEL